MLDQSVDSVHLTKYCQGDNMRKQGLPLALVALAVVAALYPAAGRAQAPSTPMDGRCQECSWYPEYCSLSGDYYETCSCANVFSGNKICRCLANRRTCFAECEEGGGACQGEASGQPGASAADATWAWAKREGKPRSSCIAPRAQAVPPLQPDAPW